MAVRLTVRKLKAIQEALNSRLAGEIDIDADRKDYQDALEWVENKLNRLSP